MEHVPEIQSLKQSKIQPSIIGKQDRMTIKNKFLEHGSMIFNRGSSENAFASST